MCLVMPKSKKRPNKKTAPLPAATKPTEEAPAKHAEAAPKKAAVASDAPLAIRLAVLEDVVRRTAQETRAFGTKLETFGAYQTELARRVADVEKRAQ